MFKFIKDKIKEYKRIKEVKFITDHLMKALTTFVYNDNYLPNFSLIETDKKKHPLYNIHSENFKNEYDYLVSFKDELIQNILYVESIKPKVSKLYEKYNCVMVYPNGMHQVRIIASN